MKPTSLNVRSIAVYLSLFTASTFAYAGGKHIHGEADLFIAFQGKQVLIEITSPADNILGFEHAPATPEEKALLEDRLVQLKQHSNWMTLVGAQCEQTEANIESPFDSYAHDKDEKHEHEEESHTKHEHEEESHAKHEHEEKSHSKHEDEDDSHSDFRISYSLTCNNSAAIPSANITAFDTFTGLETINVKWITANQQGASEVTQRSKTLRFE